VVRLAPSAVDGVSLGARSERAKDFGSATAGALVEEHELPVGARTTYFMTA